MEKENERMFQIRSISNGNGCYEYFTVKKDDSDDVIKDKACAVAAEWLEHAKNQPHRNRRFMDRGEFVRSTLRVVEYVKPVKKDGKIISVGRTKRGGLKFKLSRVGNEYYWYNFRCIERRLR